MQQKTKEEKEELVQLYKQSGMSVRAFVEEFELNLGTFRSWLYKKPVKSRPADEKCSFVELETVKVRQNIDCQNIRVQKSGMEIFIPVNLGMPVLEKILGTIKAI
jgi:transposase-like protein